MTSKKVNHTTRTWYIINQHLLHTYIFKSFETWTCCISINHSSPYTYRPGQQSAAACCPRCPVCWHRCRAVAGTAPKSWLSSSSRCTRWPSGSSGKGTNDQTSTYRHAMSRMCGVTWGEFIIFTIAKQTRTGTNRPPFPGVLGSWTAEYRK